ncbi:MAG: ABC transporter substrate-binding protein [Myxococcota bacterium]
MKRTLVSVAVAVSLFAGLIPAAHASPEDTKLRKSVKVLVNAIRYKKDDLAAKQLDFNAMVEGLLADEWAGLSDGDKKFFSDGMEKLIRQISFTAGRENFEYLDAISYKKGTVEGGVARLPSAIVIDHPIKGRSELKITWVFKKSGSTWRIYDTVILGESTMEGIREDQIEVLMDEGGIDRVKKAMNDKLAELKG